jgi:hypothetical protein
VRNIALHQQCRFSRDMKNGPLTRMDAGLLDADRVYVNLLTDTNVRALAR